MIGAVHALIGACMGSLTGSRAGAFGAGVVSHALADILPHKDLDPAIEAPLVVGAMAALAAWKGVDSPEFCGALGAVAPDVEHGLAMVGIIDPDSRAFPTHIHNGKYHGPESGSRIPQLLIATAAVGILLMCNTNQQPPE